MAILQDVLPGIFSSRNRRVNLDARLKFLLLGLLLTSAC